MSTDSTTPRPRVIVLCFDGTDNKFSDQNTNVVKFFGLLDKTSPLEQVVYYQPGVGTYINPGVVSPALTWLAKILDEGFARYLNEHVMGGYKFLMENYKAGDRICIFGFSRGAYTARALAGLLFKIGLLPKSNIEQVPFAYHLYTREDDVGLRIADKFKQTFCIPVTIDFLGVWDTVASVGLIYGRSLPFTSANSAVRVFRHALALDEHRVRFQPNMFHRESPQESARRRALDPALPVQSGSRVPGSNGWSKIYPRFEAAKPSVTVGDSVERQVSGTPRPVPSNPGALSIDDPSLGPPPKGLLSSESIPSVLEVWFAGCHSDVGGSAVPDTVRYSLADISLRWMIDQVNESECGVKFDDAALGAAGMKDLVVTSSNSLEEEGDKERIISQGGNRRNLVKEDFEAPTHDELKRNLAWWLLEVLPTKFTWQDDNGTWKSKWRINLGRGRQIRDSSPIFHVSVREKMGDANLKYKPRAKWVPGTERYTDGKSIWPASGRARAVGKFRVGLFVLACNLYASMDCSPIEELPTTSKRPHEGISPPTYFLAAPGVPSFPNFVGADSIFHWWD